MFKLSFYHNSLFFLFFLAPHAVQALELVADYSGTSFFDKWNFYGFYDNLTSGDVTWVDRNHATANRLAYVNSAGRAIIKVDNTTDVPYNIKRNSVRIETQQAFKMPSLFMADFVHMPYGCSVWPAFWCNGANWPNGGEIDIVEGVNLMAQNQMAVHTRPGCMNVSPASSGQPEALNCALDTGCTVTETKANSFGQGFAQAGGGVFATYFDVSGIFIWFWSRSDIPLSISRASASTAPITSFSDWGTPSASYASSASCEMSQYFDPQTLVLDITLCGTWAGFSSAYSQCAMQGMMKHCYNDHVIGPGSPKYDTAYFEVSYVHVYGTNSTIPLALNSTRDSPESSGAHSAAFTLELVALVIGVTLLRLFGV